MGINSFEDGTPSVLESPIATGRRITTTGVLLIKAEQKATASKSESKKD